MLIPLRPYQQEAIVELRRCIANGLRRIILNLLMGGGKTKMAADIIMSAVAIGNRVLFLAHRRELIKQCFCELVRNGVPPHEIGIIMAGVPASSSGVLFSALDPALSDDDLWKMFARVRPGAPVQVGSIDSFKNRSKPPSNIVIIDECMPAGTLVDGRPIEEIRAGDVVCAFDHANWQLVQRRVLHTFKSKPSSMVTVHFSGGHEISCTASHPFFTQRGYVPAGHLTSVDVIAGTADHDSEGRLFAWTGVDRVEVLEPGRDGTFGGVCSDGHVYNIEVEEHHNFFAEGLLTHNCHRSLAPSYRVLLDIYPSSLFVGLTATPVRTDGRGLGEFYQHIIKVASAPFLVEQGYIVEPITWTVPHDHLPDLTKVKVKAGDYDEEELAAAMDQSTLIGDIVDHWERRASGIRTVGFAATVKHSQHIVQRFLDRGIPTEHVDGETPTDQRESIFRRLGTGETLVLINVDICTEGWNMPSVKCCIQACPTQSLRRHLQQVGRVLRPYNGQTAIILDHAGNCVRHGLPQEDREFTLEAKKKRQKNPAVPSVKTCECLAVLASSVRQCPMCGHIFTSNGGRRELTEEEGELVQIPRTIAVVEDLGARWDELVARWTRENASRTVPRRPGWIWHEFKAKTGSERIPAGRKLPELSADEEARLARVGELKDAGYDGKRLYAVMRTEGQS